MPTSLPDLGSVEAVLFDVDGTLIDSNDAHAEAWTRALGEHGVGAVFADVRPLIGMGGDKLLPRVAGIADSSSLGRAITARKKEIFDELLPGLRPTPGARALVEQLRGRRVQLVIATSADDTEMRAILERAGVADLFAERTSKDDAEASKPDPDIVEAALKKSGAAATSTVMIGDTPYDIEAAARAGVRTVALRCGGYWTDDTLAGAAAIVDDPQALCDVWRLAVSRKP